MTRFTGWLAHLDTPTVDRRVLMLPADTSRAYGEWPVLGPETRSAVGVLRETWIDDQGWLRGSGEINVGALPAGYRVPRVGAEIDVDADDHSVRIAQRGNDELMVTTIWQLRAVTIGDRPAWPDARLELDL